MSADNERMAGQRGTLLYVENGRPALEIFATPRAFGGSFVPTRSGCEYLKQSVIPGKSGTCMGVLNPVNKNLSAEVNAPLP
jgi:hypothetical protein